MKFQRIALLIILFLSSLTVGFAQSSTLENLRSQLSDVEKKESELQARDRQLEEEMRPENIAKVFALSGSTRPEELREQRRRQLEKERTNVRAQLDQLAQSRARLETAIASAEAAAYTQSALPSSYKPDTPGVSSGSPTPKPKQTQRRARRKTRRANRRG